MHKMGVLICFSFRTLKGGKSAFPLTQNALCPPHCKVGRSMGCRLNTGHTDKAVWIRVVDSHSQTIMITVSGIPQPSFQ